MENRQIVLTMEAIHDIASIACYIESSFGQMQADSFQASLLSQFEMLNRFPNAFPKTHLKYRNYDIFKQSFSPSIIFYIFNEQANTVYILRVLREEQNWSKVLLKHSKYNFPSDFPT